jgi:hypothetical protein
MLDIFTKPTYQKETEADAEADLMHYLVHIGGMAYPVNRKLQAVLQKVEPEKLVHWVSGGAWNMIDLFMGVLAMAGKSDVYISSYSFSEKPARIIADLVHDGAITNLYCLIDSRVDTRSASALTLIQNCAAKCVLLDTHAKVTLITNGKQYYTIVGSANYTTNRRWETGFVCMDPETFLFHQNWMQHAMERGKTD